MNTDSTPPMNLRALRIVIVAMMGGILSFSVIAVVISPRMTKRPELAGLLLLILGALVVVEMLVYFVIRRGTMAKLRQSLREAPLDADSEGRMLPAMATLTLIGAAMAEGIGLFGVVAFLITGQTAALAAPAIALLVLVLRIPTQEKLSAFVADAIQETLG